MTSVQDVNYEMKLKYMNVLKKLAGEKVDISFCERINVSGKLHSFQRGGLHYLVNDLQTPTGVIDNAVLRTRDTVSINFNMTQSQ